MGEAFGVRIDNLGRRFGALEAVRGISLEVREGETFGLLGPNGAGKTTTLSMLSTILRPSYGEARIFGRSLTGDVANVRRIVGLAPQELSLYPGLTGEENLRFFGRMHGLGGERLGERAARLLDLVGLAPRRRDRVATYSGGMKRRLNLACSLMHDPRLVLLDEPTVGVDPQSRQNILDAIAELARQGATVVYTTHYMEEAESLCDRIAIMDEGRVIALGTLTELLDIVGMGEVVEIRGEPRRIDVERLAAIPEATKVETDDAGVHVFVKSAARALAPIAALVAESGSEVEIHRVDLERVFMHLTGRALRD
jgi:ABC-2 type transport system ATP-binding protein